LGEEGRNYRRDKGYGSGERKILGVDKDEYERGENYLHR